MELQQINNQIYPPLERQLTDENLGNPEVQRNSFNARKKLQYTFLPYHDYFIARNTRFRLSQNKQSYYLHSNLYDRQRLSLQRQSMYYRGAIDEFLSDQFLKPFVEESQTDRGFVMKRGNKSVILEGVLYYAHQSSVRAIQIPTLRKQDELELHNHFEAGNIILQIQALNSRIFNKNYEGVILIVRFARNIAILSVSQRKILHSFPSESELIQLYSSSQMRGSFGIVEYDQKESFLTSVWIEPSGQLKRKQQTTTKIDNLVNTAFKINKNQTLVTKYEGLYLIDPRVGNQLKLYAVKNLSQQRIYSSIPLKGLYNYTPFIACCHSRYISIFDLRKSDQMIEKRFHYCQQAPPEIMSFYDGSGQTHLQKPVIVCHAPYTLGSSLVASLDIKELRLTQHSEIDRKQININSFSLLSDGGKSSLVGPLQNFFNESVSVYNFSPNQLCVFKTDNHGNVDMQFLNNDQRSKKYQRRQLKFQEQDKKNLNPQKLDSEEQIWLQENLKYNYFVQSVNYTKVQQDLQQQVQIKLKNKKNKKNKIKHNKVQKKKQLINQPLTEIDIQEIFKPQIQNSQEFEKSLTSRRLNFADFTQFYSTFKKKAKEHTVLQSDRQTCVEYSINSTQASSEGFIYSQTDDGDDGSKGFSYHNKKLMNFSIFDKLRNQWDQ